MDEALALLNNHQTDLDLVKVQLASVGLLTNADFISQSCRSWMCCQARGPSRACPNSFLDQCAQPPMPHAWLLSRPAWPGTFRGSCHQQSINQFLVDSPEKTTSMFTVSLTTFVQCPSPSMRTQGCTPEFLFFDALSSLSFVHRCEVCGRLLGEAPFAHYPNDVVCHVRCVVSKGECPVTGTVFDTLANRI